MLRAVKLRVEEEEGWGVRFEKEEKEGGGKSRKGDSERRKKEKLVFRLLFFSVPLPPPRHLLFSRPKEKRAK